VFCWKLVEFPFQEVTLEFFNLEQFESPDEWQLKEGDLQSKVEKTELSEELLNSLDASTISLNGTMLGEKLHEPVHGNGEFPDESQDGDGGTHPLQILSPCHLAPTKPLKSPGPK
jgi:hypothetical protein